MRPSILFINRVYPPHRGASGRLLRELAKYFSRRNWQVTVLTTGPRSVKEKDGSITVIRIRAPDHPQSFIGYAWIGFRLLLKACVLPKAHLCVSMTDPPMAIVIGRVYSLLKRAKHMHWCQDLYPDILPALDKNLPSPLFSLLQKIQFSSLQKTDKIIAIGRCMARHLVANDVPSSQISVIPNWPDLHIGKGAADPPGAHTKKKPAQTRQASFPMLDKLPENGVKSTEEILQTGPKFRVLYAGNIGLAHPIQLILDAAEIISEDYPEIEFVFAGDGPRYDHLTQKRNERNLSNIKFLPYQPPGRLRNLLESGDLHLITMNPKAQGCLVPSKFYSAMAVGRPCIFIGPAQNEITKLIKSYRAGSVLSNLSAKRLAKLIIRYRMNSDAWFSAHEGAIKAGEIFTPEESMKAWFERAQKVLERPQTLRLENKPLKERQTIS